MSSLWVRHPMLRKQGRKIPSLTGKPSGSLLHTFNLIFFVQARLFFQGQGHTGQFGESVRASNHADFPDLYQPKLEVQVWLLQTACNRSSYIHSPHKTKSHAPSWSFYFKPAQITSDLGSSCFNSALQAHSSCTRRKQQTFYLTCSFSSSTHSFKTKLFRDFTAFSAKKDIFSLKSTNTNISTWHKITEEVKALSLHCEMHLQTTTSSPSGSTLSTSSFC